MNSFEHLNNQLSGFSTYPDGSPSELILISGVVYLSLISGYRI